MILEILKYGDPVLRVKGREVLEIDDEVKRLAADMIDTMRDANGVGLAAQQVGHAVQLTVIDVADVEDRPSAMFINDEQVELAKHMPMVLVNPQLKLSQEKDVGTEGCLSFPEMSAEITRASGLRCKARLLNGGTIEFDAAGLLARALQHEVDHLHGVLFIDRMSSAARAGLAGRLKRLQKENRK